MQNLYKTYIEPMLKACIDRYKGPYDASVRVTSCIFSLLCLTVCVAFFVEEGGRVVVISRKP